MALKGRFRYKILEVLEQAILAENIASGEDFPRRLIGDDVALVVAPKRENVMGGMRGDRPGREAGVYIDPRPQDLCLPSPSLILIAETLIR
jgi:hypothetical protein